jgi:predicted dehydrogenase
MTNELRWGFLGTGWIADVVAKDLAAIGRSVAAVGSRNLSTAQAFAQTHSVASSFGSYEELCASPDVDAIYVATPNPFHLEHAKLAFAHGKHVLLEKPAALNQKQVREIQGAAKAANRFLMEAMWSRFVPSQLSVKAAVASGEIGDPVMVSAEYSENKLPAENHERMWSRDLGGGTLLDLGIYPLAFIENFVGIPTEVETFGSVAPQGLDQRLVSILKFEGGELAQLATSMTGAGSGTASIIGTKGRIEIGFPIYGQFEYQVFDLDRNLLRSYQEPIVGTGRQFQFLAAEQVIAAGKTEHEAMSWATSLALAGVMDQMRRQVGVSYDVD